MRSLFAIVMIGICGCDSPSANGVVPTVPSPTPPSEASSAEKRPEQIRQPDATNADLVEVDTGPPVLQIDDIAFSSPTLKEAVQRFYAAAEGMAEPGWYRSGFRQTSAGGESIGLRDVEALWCTEARPGGTPLHDADHSFMLEKRPFHTITIKLAGGSDNITMARLHLTADWLDKRGTGWVTRLYFTGDVRNDGRFVGRYLTTRFDHDSFRPFQSKKGEPAFDDLSERHSLSLGITSITTTSELGDTTFDARLSARHGSVLGPGRVDEDINDYAINLLKSEEGFRKTATAELDELETACREKIPSGDLIVSFDRRLSGVRDGSDPWVNIGYPMLSEFSKEEREAVFRVMLAEIERRKALVREHSGELYEGVTKAFPLLECLKLSESEAPEPK